MGRYRASMHKETGHPVGRTSGLGRIRGSRIVVRYPHVQDRNARRIFWRKLWTSFLSFSCSSCSSVEVVIGDIGGGDKSPPSPPSNRLSYGQRLIHGVRAPTPCATIMEREQNRMNIFTIIGVVVVVILVAGYFGVHGVSL